MYCIEFIKVKKVILMCFILLLTVVSCGEDEKKEKEKLNKVCELNQITCKDELTLKTCVTSDNGNIWEESPCTIPNRDSRICETNFDLSVSCNKPNLCNEDTCEQSLGCTDGGGECKANTNGKNICYTNDYMGDCVICKPYSSNISCNDNKLKKCTSEGTSANADWVLIEECENGCNTEGNACK